MTMSAKFSHIGQAVRFLRKEKKLTLQQLADAVTDYDAGNLSRFERGDQGISETKLKEICDALITTVSELYALVEGRSQGLKLGPFSLLVSNKPPTTAKELYDQIEARIDNLPEDEKIRLLSLVSAAVADVLKNKK